MANLAQNEAAPEEPHGDLTLGTLAMPADTNSASESFGGLLMRQMDITSGMSPDNPRWTASPPSRLMVSSLTNR